jgi:DNA primase
MDHTRKVVAFAGRTFEPNTDPNTPKYVNSPTTPVYEKGRILYGLAQARPHIKSGEVTFIVEGYFDLISLAAHGVKPVVASMGTALTQRQVNLLKGLTREVQLVFDGDSAGEEASKRAMPLFYNAELDSRVVRLPQGHDPDSYVRQFGSKAFYDLADQAMELSDFLFQSAMSKKSKTISGEGRIISMVQDILSQIPDAAKGQYLRNQLAQKLNISPELLSLSQREKPLLAGSLGHLKTAARPNELPTDYNMVAGRFLSFMITHPECQRLLTEELIKFWPRDRTRPVMEGFLAQYKSQKSISPDELRLEEDPLMSRLIFGAMMAAREASPQEAMGIANNLLTKLSSHDGQKMNEEYTQAIKAAEARGDHSAVLELMAAKQR